MLCGALFVTFDHGMLLYSKSFMNNFGLSFQLGGNEYQLSAMLYTLYLTSHSLEEVPVTVDSEHEIKALNWIQFDDKFLHFVKEDNTLYITICSYNIELIDKTEMIQLSTAQTNKIIKVRDCISR